MLDHDSRSTTWQTELASILAEIDRYGMPAPVILAVQTRRCRAIKPAPWWEE